MRNHRREEIFIVDWLSLPQEQQDYVTNMLDGRMKNGALLEWHTELGPCGSEKSFKDTLTMEQIESYHKDQSETNGFIGDLDDFIDEYGLKFEIWMIEQNFDIEGIKKIYIDVYW